MQDNDHSGTLTVDEITQGINQIGLELSDEEAAELVQEFDADGEGSVNYEEFLAAVRPEMNEERMAVVEEAFSALDESGDGKITVDDLREKYRAANHPSVQDGSESEDDVLGRFISRLEEGLSEDGGVTKNEFIDYYSGISNSIDNDELFIEIIKILTGFKNFNFFWKE
ncbi:Crustacean calcium-binding protein 23 [Armadillidium vulgare]|nr:Crustacean calcium-binding protein 23 [Armadillidium vulgare]